MRLYLYIMFLCLLSVNTFAENNKVYITKLDGKWRFSIGNNQQWSDPGFDDSGWDLINVPSAWEEQGFNGYDGYAWYRISFSISKDFKNKEIFLSLGYIDDVEQVFFNGKLVGYSGKFPPDYSTAAEAKRKYPIPEECINFQGLNTIAIKVYNHQMNGGIISGEIGLYHYKRPKPEIPLSGMWNFKTGDNNSHKEPNAKDKSWKKIVVPATWENQGFKGYNGIAWYRKSFEIPEELTGQELVLILGDLAEDNDIYINGTLINKKIKTVSNISKNDELKKYRAIVLTPELVKANAKNTISIRINANNQNGIEGPVGIYKESTYLEQ